MVSRCTPGGKAGIQPRLSPGLAMLPQAVQTASRQVPHEGVNANVCLLRSSGTDGIFLARFDEQGSHCDRLYANPESIDNTVPACFSGTATTTRRSSPVVNMSSPDPFQRDALTAVVDGASYEVDLLTHYTLQRFVALLFSGAAVGI